MFKQGTGVLEIIKSFILKKGALSESNITHKYCPKLGGKKSHSGPQNGFTLSFMNMSVNLNGWCSK